MMKHHSSGRARALGGAAAVALLAGASLSFGVPSFAQQSEATTTRTERAEQHQRTTDGDERREERVIIITRHGDHDGDHHSGAGHSEGDHDAVRQRETVRTIIREHHGDAEGDHDGDGARIRHFTLRRGDHDGEVRHFTLMRDGHGEHVGMADCREGNRQMVNSNENRDGHQVRFILCGPGDADPARRIHALERAREILADEGGLGAEGRQSAIAAIDAELARLRGGNR